MLNPLDLTNKNIMVTGASSGIGRDTALLLSKLGAKTILIARNEEKLKNVIHQMDGNDHIYYPFDLSNIDEIELLFKKICFNSYKLDGLVHCAGIDVCRPLKITTKKILNEIMTINFYSFYELTRVFSNKKYNNGGSIVAISSVAAQRGRKTLSAYSASKAAIEGAVRSLSVELADINIRINAIAPSFVETEMFKKYIDLAGEEAVKDIMKKQILGIGKTEDVANAAAYLLSDSSKFITGSVFSVDGGYLAQ